MMSFKHVGDSEDYDEMLLLMVVIIVMIMMLVSRKMIQVK